MSRRIMFRGRPKTNLNMQRMALSSHWACQLSVLFSALWPRIAMLVLQASVYAALNELVI